MVVCCGAWEQTTALGNHARDASSSVISVEEKPRIQLGTV